MRIGTFLGAMLLIANFLTVDPTEAARTWVNVGPAKGGPIFPDRSDPNRWYSLSWFGGGLYRSDNGGRFWQKITSPAPANFLVHPNDTTLYLVHAKSNNSEYSLYVSKDYGQSFVRMGALGNVFWRGLRTDPANPSTLYATDFMKSIYRTTDLGVEWQQIPFSFTPTETFGCLATHYFIEDLLVSPLHSTSIYLSIEMYQCPQVNGQSTSASFLLASHDGGLTWKEEVISRTGKFAFFFDSATPDRAYALSDKVKVLTTDGWQQYPEPPCPGAFYCSIENIVVVPRQSNELVIVQAQYDEEHIPVFKLCVTKNNGLDWEISDSPFSSDHRFELYISDTQLTYQLASEPSGGGIYRKDADWSPANSGFEQRTGSMRILAKMKNLYAYSDYLFYRSRNEGKTWKDLRFRLPKGAIAVLALDPNDPEHVIIEMARRNLHDNEYRINSYMIVTFMLKV